MKSHALIDERSLAFGRALAARLQDHPEMIEQARATLNRWLPSCSPRARPALLEWRAALDGPIEGVVSLLTGRDERAVRLGQSNPFAGLLPNEQRNEILRRFHSYEAESSSEAQSDRTDR